MVAKSNSLSTFTFIIKTTVQSVPTGYTMLPFTEQHKILCVIRHTHKHTCDSNGKESPCSAGNPALFLSREDPLEKEMAMTLIFLPGESHGNRSLAGCSP